MSSIMIRTHDKYSNALAIIESTKEFKLSYGTTSYLNIFFESFFGGAYTPLESDWYNVNKITDLALIETEISKTKGNLGKILATGLLFGPIGAIAGSIGNSQRTTNKILYSVRFTLNDIKLAVVDLHCNNLETALRVINTIKLLKESSNENTKKTKIKKR
jgi:hypothetical protein